MNKYKKLQNRIKEINSQPRQKIVRRRLEDKRTGRQVRIRLPQEEYTKIRQQANKK